MVWFKKLKIPKMESKPKRQDFPGGLWVKCGGCKEIIYRKEVERNFKVCPKCNYHFRIGARERIKLLIDDNRFTEYDTNIISEDPLKFRDLKWYKDRLKDTSKRLGMKDAVISLEGNIHSRQVQMCVFDFSFMGGSMGSVVGEKIVRCVERAESNRNPLIIVSCSGGARMQEGMFSLMQMGKTSGAIARFSKTGLPYISILTDPTTGGVTASFAMLGDIIIAEPGSLIGFAGPRVIAQTIKENLPPGFQRSEFLLEHGMIDMIVNRKDMKDVIGKLLDHFMN